MKLIRCKINTQDILIVSNDYKLASNEEIIITGNKDKCSEYKDKLSNNANKYKHLVIND